jgi:hypothetical protein
VEERNGKGQSESPKAQEEEGKLNLYENSMSKIKEKMKQQTN